MIQIKDLEFSYRKKNKLFTSLNVTFNKGQVYGILGHNGAGKTTLLKLIAGLLFPKSGDCNVYGFTPAKREPDFLEDIFYIPEEFEFPSLTIEKYVKIHARFYPKFDLSTMDHLLNEFELTGNSKINSLSFGQKKKLLIAFAISTNCRVLLMDEPTNGLDIPSKSTFRKIIASYFNEDRIFLISTHQVRDLDNILDTLIVIEKGKVIFNQTVGDIQENLCFKKVKNVDDTPNVLFADKEFGGYSVLTNKSGTDETKIDIELLYKAINSNSALVNNAFEQKNNSHE
ncbi:MAG: ABC transporter ATP-binding protein [Bacteroidetes bacterium]|nr:ABC transporter ATP-binding protein [Bacteroidota bacterium]